MKKIFYPIISTAAAVLLSSAAAQAQTASFLDVNPDPAAMSMAGTGTVMEATPFAMWNNIAATALDDSPLQVGAAYSLWQPSYTSNHVAAVAGYGRVARFMTVSASVKYFSHKPYDVTDGVTGAVTGSFTPMDLQAGVGLGFRILPILSLGANVNYVYSDIGGPKKGGAVSADFGALLDLRFLRVGLTFANIGSKLDYGGAAAYGLPANVKLGVGTIQRFGPEDKHAVAVTSESGMVFEQKAFFTGLSAQYEYNDFVRVGLGYHYGNQDKQVTGSYASFGAGIKFLGISVNAAYILGFKQASDISSPVESLYNLSAPISNTFSVGIGYEF